MPDQSSVAVFIRIHKFSLKVAHLFCELEDGIGYDLFFMTDDTQSELDVGGKSKVSFTEDSLRRFHVDASYYMSIVHYGDLMFSIFQNEKPGYRHYIMLDFDIHFAYLGRAWMETLCHLLKAEDSVIDLVAPQVGPAPPSWVWYKATATRFAEVMGSFFPVVIVSERAIRCNEARRAEEAAIRRQGEEPIFCEAFLPSALYEAGYNLVDLNTLMPGSYALPSFNFALPAPFHPDEDCEIGRIIHPIKAMLDAPLAPDVKALISQAEPTGGQPMAAPLAFELAAILVREQAAYRGLQATAGTFCG